MNSGRVDIWWLSKFFVLAFILSFFGVQQVGAQYYPVHATVQWPSPQSPYLSDYYTGSRDRLIVTLFNRDLQQPLLFSKLRIKIKSTGFLATTREEYDYPMLELHANVPTRLTNIDLSPYLHPSHLQVSGILGNGQLPTGYTEFAVQVIDYYTGRALSAWHTGRAYLDVKKPPLLNFPEKDAHVGMRDPLYIRFGWTPRHQGLAGTEYEFVLKELPDNGAAPQSAFAYGNEIYRIRTRNTYVNYTHLEPILFPGRRYGWQVQAIARDGIDEVGLFENGGFSEIHWFYLSDNCLAPTGLKAVPRFAKVDLSWDKVTGTTGYVVECRPKTKLNVYEWSRVRVAGESLTLGRLNPGWTYEWRVGTLCTEDRPVFSDVKEFTLSKYNDELLSDCGKEPVRSDLSQEPNLRIKAGDVVIIGGDYPMTIIEVTSLGDGWYAGRGKTRLKTIIDAPVALRFDRLRINVDNFQVDGTVEASYDEQKGKMGNLDYIDDGGKDIQPSTLRIREHKLDFTLPDIPEIVFNPDTGELEFTDADGNPHTIQIDIPENASYESIFPIIVTDDKGNSYLITPAGQNTDGGDNGDRQGKVPLQADRVERVGDFNTDELSDKHGYVRFERGEGRYAFDSGTEEWYKKSVKTDRFYKSFSKNYIAPWKLVPVGESDVVTARYDGRKDIDLRKVRFVSEPNAAALPAQLSESEQTWTVSLRSVAENSTYDVFAVYEGEVIGKLRVVSYAKQHHRVTLVPINEARLDKAAIEQELNAIYSPVGVQFTVNVDENMRGNYDWEVESEKDGLLSTVGKSFWGYDKELRESAEMMNLQKIYQEQAGELDGAYLFVLDGAKGLEGRKDELKGEMPRKSRFGYIFAGNSPNTASLSYTIAHELGHGIFTLQHTFDSEYGGRKSEGKTANLMDYNGGKNLAAFQWNVMANPAVFTVTDKAEEGKIKRYKSRMVCIPKEISDAIMNSQKAVLSAGGEKMEFPKGTIIKALFYGDTSENPARDGSVAMFETNSNLYTTLYLIKTSRFDSYGCITSNDTIPWKIVSSNKNLVEILVNPSNHTVTVEGREFSVDATNFACGDQKISTMELNRFYVNQRSEETLKSWYGNDTITISEDRAILDALKNNFQNTEQQDITTVAQLQKILAKQLSYRGKGLTQERQFIVVSAQVQKGNLKEEDWNAVARTLFTELELNDNDVLVTVPYAKYRGNGLSQSNVTLYMPGFAYGTGTKLDKSRLQKKYDCTDGTIGKTGQGVGDFILSLFEMCEIPAVKPRVLIQTVTKPGFGVKKDRNKYEFEDAQGNGLTPASNIVAEDMRYGTSFDLSTIKDAKVRENLERLSKKSDDELFKNLINLAEWVSRGDLEDNNKRMIAEWRKQTYKTAEEHYTDSRLMDAVFKDGSTQENLVEAIRKILKISLKKSNGSLSSLQLTANDLSNINLQRPTFSISKDKGSGLTFALNDTWGLKVTLLNYRYDVATKKYWAKLRFDIFDHFGLDISDIEKFGSMENVRDKTAPWGDILSYLTRPKDERGYDLSDTGASDIFFQEAAEGFCSWFILQYMRGYKPFVTMMSKEIEINDILGTE